jgi:hypothetical protein
MPKLPDLPGKNLIGGSTRRAQALAGAAGAGALAAGGFVAKRLLSHRGGSEKPEATAVDNDDIAVAPAPPTPSVAKPEPAKEPKPKAAKPAPAKASKPKPAKPEPKAPKPKAAKPKPAKAKAAKPKAAKPKATKVAKPEPGTEPGDQRGGKDPHHALNNPVADPDPTEYPDPYDKREDPRDPVDPDGAPFGEEPHPQTGSESTSEPPRSQDPEVGDRAKPPRRDNLDD